MLRNFESHRDEMSIDSKSNMELNSAGVTYSCLCCPPGVQLSGLWFSRNIPSLTGLHVYYLHVHAEWLRNMNLSVRLE